MESIDAWAKQNTLIEECKELHQQARLRLSCGALQKLKVLQQSLPHGSPLIETHADATLSEIVQDQQDCEQLLSAIADNENWTLIAHEKKLNVKSFFRRETGMSTLSFKVMGTIGCPLFNVVAILNEIDLLGSIMNNILFSIEAKELKSYSDFTKAVYIKMTFPWPFSSRDLVIKARTFDLLDDPERCIVICGKSIAEPFENLEVPIKGSIARRMHLYDSGGVLTPQDGGIECSVIANFDVKMGFVPQALIDSISKKLSITMFLMFSRAATNLGEAHLKRIERNQRLYDTLRLRTSAALSLPLDCEVNELEEE